MHLVAMGAGGYAREVMDAAPAPWWARAPS